MLNRLKELDLSERRKMQIIAWSVAIALAVIFYFLWKSTDNTARISKNVEGIIKELQVLQTQNNQLAAENKALSEENRLLNRCAAQLAILHHNEPKKPLSIDNLDTCIISSQELSREQGISTPNTQSLQPGSTRPSNTSSRQPNQTTQQSPAQPVPPNPPNNPPPEEPEEPEEPEPPKESIIPLVDEPVVGCQVVLGMEVCI